MKQVVRLEVFTCMLLYFVAYIMVGVVCLWVQEHYFALCKSLLRLGFQLRK